MLSPCHSDMKPEEFIAFPSSTNAVESHNRFLKGTHPEPLKLAMQMTYQEDVVKILEVMATRQGLPTMYEDPSGRATGHRSKKQSEARRKRRRVVDDNDVDGPPDTKRNFSVKHPKSQRTSLDINGAPC